MNTWILLGILLFPQEGLKPEEAKKPEAFCSLLHRQNGWANFRPESWVKTQTRDTTETYQAPLEETKILRKQESSWAFFNVVSVNGKREEKEFTGWPTSRPPASVKERVLGTETITINEKPFVCEVTERKEIYKDWCDTGGVRSSDRVRILEIWKTHQVSENEGVLKVTERLEGAALAKQARVIHFLNSQTISGKSFLCTVVKTDVPSTEKISTTEWLCPQIPGGLARRLTQTFQTNGKEEVQREELVIEFEAK